MAIKMTRAEYEAKYGKSPVVQPTSSVPVKMTRAEYEAKFGNGNSITDTKIGGLPVVKQLNEFGVGAGTAIAKGGLNLGKAFLKGSNVISNAMGNPKNQYDPLINKIENIKQKVYTDPFKKELNTGFGKTGKVVGEVAPYIAGAGTTSALSNVATKAVPVFKGAGIARTLVGAGTEGIANFGQALAFSGGDTKEAKRAGLTAGLFKGATQGTGEITKAIKLPQKLMSGVYKTDKKEVAEIFNNVDNAIPNNKGPKLSEWALNKGLKGGLESQAKQVKEILDKSENAVINTAEAAKKRITVEPNLFKMAQGIMADFKDVGRGEIASQADEFLRAVKDNSVSVKNAIKFRRLIDNTLRTKSSFNNPALADNLSYWADDLRKSINAVDGLGAINKDYALALKARDAIIKAAVTVKNQPALGALESYALGGGMATGAGLPALATIAGKRAARSARVTSRLAQGLKNLPTSTKLGAGTRSVLGNVVNQSLR